METTIQQQHALSLKNACVEFMFAYQQRNVDKMLEFCSHTGEIQFLPLGKDGTGKIHELGKGLWTALIDCFPDIDNTIDAAVAEEEDTVRCQVVIKGIQAKDFADIPSKGKYFESDHIFIFHLDNNNKIDNISVSWDHADFKRQLGS